MGARNAVKAAVMAADAATADKPAPAVHPRPAQTANASSAPGDAAARTATRVRQAASQAQQARANVRRGGKRFGEAVWGPFVKLSGVLWLEVMGVFFGLFVMTAGMNVWKLRGNLHDLGANHTAHQHLLFSIAMLAIFGYFCISSFVRASRRGRS